MRGKGQFPQFYFSQIGITPAYAGKRSQQDPHGSGWRDHPRLCGEKIDFRSNANNDGGSPPPMRGKAFLVRHSLLHMRITPAYAGKRSQYKNMKQMCKDHPRLCGEKVDITSFGASRTGSPPPMRGKVSRGCTFLGFFGITPAYAGKRPLRQACLLRSRDHPRLCGEKIWTKSMMRFIRGSPPPMRGKATTCQSG